VHIYIDESGDSGFKFNHGSSRYLVIALVVFESENEAEFTYRQMQILRAAWGKSKHFEFRFSQLDKDERLVFLKSLKNFNFKIRAVIFDKQKIHFWAKKNFVHRCYQAALDLLLRKSNADLFHSQIFIDNFSGWAMKEELQQHFARENLIFQDSKYNILIQVADLVAGALHKSALGNNTYRELIADKEEEVRVY